MASPIQVFYYGDLSVDPYDAVIDLVTESHNSESLPQFLSSAFEALQDAKSTLPLGDRSPFRGRDFAQTISHIRDKRTRHVEVTSVLSCVAQLGWTILHRERDPESWSEHVDRVIVGACTGMIPAIAAAAARSDIELLRSVPMFVQLSLRLGLEAARRSLSLEESHDPWSIAISGISTESVRAELRLFNQSRHIPSHRLVYISAYSASSVTLSGPPSLLQEFLSREPMHQARKLPLPIYGLFHASHIHLPDVEAIVGQSDLLDREVRSHRSLLHSNLCNSSDIPSLKDLLIRAVTQIFQAPLDIDEDTRQLLRRTQGRAIQLTSIGPARVSHIERTLTPAYVHRFGSRKLQSRESCSSFPKDQNSVAVVGMAGRFPDAQNVNELWKILIEGRDVHRMIPIDRFDVHTHVDPTGKVKNKSLTPYGCFDAHVGEFDISLFKMSPREAAQTDPMQRMMLLTAYEALESAGYYDNGDEGVRPRNGTFYGVAGDDYRQVNFGQDVDINYITGGTRAFGPGRVSYYFGWEGPSMSVDTACSASGMAIHQAISSLKSKECDVALAGGANLLTCSDMFAGLSRAKFVSSTGPCKTFDESADGYCRADATATVVLKRYKDAVKDKDNILGVIRSIETHHAGTAVSLTHPEADTQSTLFESVLRSAGMSVDDIDHIELHGTGTQAGDLAEASSVVKLLRQPRPKDRPLTISSVKPNVGHSEAAAGVTSLIKGLLMLQYQVIPQHVGIKTRINPMLPRLVNHNVIVPQTNMPYPVARTKELRRMLVNNFNATGGITAMLLEEHRPFPILVNDERIQYPITLSGASAVSLAHSQHRLLQHLKSCADIAISHLSYTLTARRLHHKHRFACVADSPEALIQKLEANSSTSGNASKRGTSAFGVFVFTGQASSYSGMARRLFTTNKAFRSHVLRSNALCQEMELPSFLEFLTDEKAEFSKFSQTQCQLALVSLELALATLLESWGIRPKAVLGHSLGEYSALCFSRVLSLADTLYLIGKRGLLLESRCKANEHSMAAISMSASNMENTLGLAGFSECEITCLNAPDQVVVGGPSTTMEKLVAHFITNNIRVTQLLTPYAFHSKQMDGILPGYGQIADHVLFKKPSIPLASTLLGEIVQEAGIFNPQYLSRQTREHVRFQEALQKLEGFSGEGKTPVWLELGLGPTCLPMIAATLRVNSTSLVCALDPKKPNWLTLGNLLTKYYESNGDVRPAPVPSQATQVAGPMLGSSTLQILDCDYVEKGIRKLQFTSNLTSGNLKTLIGRLRNARGFITLIPVFADIALAATSYICKTSNRSLDFSVMQVSALEISFDQDLHVPRATTFTAMQRPSDTNIIEIAIRSSDHDEATEIARCEVVIGDSQSWTKDTRRDAYLYQSRTDLFNLFLTNGQVTRLSEPELHQGSFNDVDCKATSLGTHEVLLNMGLLEATAKISLPSSDGKFVCDPTWLDTLIHVPYLIANGNHDSNTEVCLTCCGWTRMNILLPFKPNHIYRVHVRLQSGGQTGFVVGDMVVFDEASSKAAAIKKLRFRPASGTNLNITSPLSIGPNKVDISKSPTDSAYDSGSQTPKFPSQNSGCAISPQLSQDSRVDKADHTVPVVSQEKSVDNGKAPEEGTLERRSSEPDDLSAFVRGRASDRVSASISASTEPVREQQHDGQAPTDGSGGPVDFIQILALIAEEIGVETDSLRADVQLDDLGVDSIIQISLVARMQEYLATPLPPSFLVEFNSIAKLRQAFSGR